MQEDVYGDGLKAYQKGEKNATFVVESDLAETDEWPVSTFFRAYAEMPEVEQMALQRATGKVLDVGAGVEAILCGCRRGIWMSRLSISPRGLLM